MFTPKMLVIATASLGGIAAAALSSLYPTPTAGTAPVTVLSTSGNGKTFIRAVPITTNAAAAVAAPFVESSTDFPNPERGFYRATWNSTLGQLSQDDATDAFSNGFRLLFARINLEDYKTTDTIPATYLNTLRTALGYARSAGVKLVVRAVYNYPDSETDLSAGDAPLSRIQSHINQLKPILQDNSDVIAFVQAGFVGVWGEWHSSKNGFDTNSAARTAVKDALVAAVPTSRFIQFRYPKHLREWASTIPTVDSAIANNFRLGFHNDCFLSGVADIGTYNDDVTIRNQERTYADSLGDAGPVGGETCDSTWSSSNVRRTACSDIIGEGARYNFTYLNAQYWRPEFHDRWISNGCMPDVQRKLGYRFVITQASHANAVSRGASLNVAFGIKNAGWARLYNTRPVQVLLQNVSTNSYRRMTVTGSNVDPRKWLPSTTTSVNANLVVPSSLTAGSYRVLLALPDGSSTLVDDGRYAIRFANDNNNSSNQYWDSGLAAFSTGTIIQVN
jgi:hypothetical protein